VTTPRRRFGSVDDPTLRKIALDKLQGYTNPEIAQRNGIAMRSVERKLQLIRKALERQIRN
jgi:DNA-directed RNA polymerase specialized sigma24 family protein